MNQKFLCFSAEEVYRTLKNKYNVTLIDVNREIVLN